MGDTLSSTTNTPTRTMKAFIALCLIAAVSGSPMLDVCQQEVAPEPIKILTYSSVPYGQEPVFSYAFTSENDIEQSAQGQLKLVEDPETQKSSEVMVMQGSYRYVGLDGLTYQVDWIADENGFQVDAPRLPQPVAPNPPEVAAAVEAQLRAAGRL